MSQLQVTKITTVDNTTPLILATGNAGGGQIIIQSSNTDVMFSGNINFTGTVTGDGSGLYLPTSAVANVAFNTANAAFAVANTIDFQVKPAFDNSNAAFKHANAAFDSANNVAPQVTPSFNTANAAFNTANAAFASANNVAPQVTPAFQTANAAFDTANAAFASANNVAPQVTPAFNTANLAFSQANAAYAKANAGGANVGQTTPVGAATGSLWWNSDLGKLFIYYTDPANTSAWVETSPSASSIEGSIITGYINPVYNTMNVAFNTTNAAFSTANAAYGAANNVGPQLAPAYNTANVAYTTANAAYVAANVAASSGGVSPFLLMGA